MCFAEPFDFNSFLRDNALWIAIGAAGLILLVLLIILFVNLGKKGKKKEKTHRVINASAYMEALGGADNVLSHTLMRSRIVLELKDYAVVDKEKLKEAGVDSFIMMSNKLTLVIQGDAAKVNEVIFPEG
ncbi:MAG: hypothetical protein K6E59_04995 [Bacilli bacterium]|nr:hypothetical protein [Bacilli bacterium]